MIRDAFALVIVIAGAAVVSYNSPAGKVFLGALFVLGLFCLLLDALLLTEWGRSSSRVAPLLAPALLLQGRDGYLVALLALLAGGLLVGLKGRTRRKLPADLIRSLAPLGAGSLLLLPLPEPFPRLALLLGFLLLSLLLEPRRYALRPSMLGLFCAPFVALATHQLAFTDPWSLPLAVPVLIGLGRGRDDAFPLIMKFRRALQLSQAQVQAEAERARKFHHLLQAANRMARTLDPRELERVLVQAALTTGVERVEVQLSRQGTAKAQTIPLLEGRGRMIYHGPTDPSQRDQLEILARIFSTCWENADLHRQVVEALEETKRSQAQLVESSRLRAMGLMAAGVAHEVNTPLGAIQLSTELVEASLSRNPEEAPKHLAAIERATERARKAVQRILYYARPLGEEEQETFEVAEVVEDALDLLSHRVERAQTVVERDLQSGLHLTGERQAFFTLVFNLILNGVEAGGAGKLWVRAGATKSHLVLEVEDSGSGVPPELRDQIFDPFFTTMASGEGAGLGLHLAREAAESFGGRLLLSPSRGHGAVFRAEFPYSQGGGQSVRPG